MTEFSIKNLTEEELVIVNKWPEVYLYPSEYVQKEYIDKGRVKQEEVCNLRYGFEFNFGWLKLADELGESATEFIKLLKLSKIQENAYIKSCIFKEKYGQIDFQGDNNLNGIYRNMWSKIESSIERKSWIICEITGNDGVACSRGGWHKTLCKEEAIKNGYYPVNKSYQKYWNLYPPEKKSE